MRASSLFLALLGCSNGNPTPDGGGTDAAPDVPVTTDSGSDAAGDAGGCNVTASATVSGTFLGTTLAPKDEISYQSQPTSQYEAVVGVVDFTGICALGNDIKASSNVLAFIYSSSTPLAAATLNLSQTNVLTVQYTKFDATCKPQGEAATSGTVTFTRVDSCGIVGTFDLMFNADHVTGSFSAPTCANQPDGGASACK